MHRNAHKYKVDGIGAHTHTHSRQMLKLTKFLFGAFAKVICFSFHSIIV